MSHVLEMLMSCADLRLQLICNSVPLLFSLWCARALWLVHQCPIDDSPPWTLSRSRLEKLALKMPCYSAAERGREERRWNEFNGEEMQCWSKPAAFMHGLLMKLGWLTVERPGEALKQPIPLFSCVLQGRRSRRTKRTPTQRRFHSLASNTTLYRAFSLKFTSREACFISEIKRVDL